MNADNTARPVPGDLYLPDRVTGTGGENSMTGEKSVLRWGGLAGMLSPISIILTAITLFVFVPSAPAGLHGPVMRYPDARMAYVVGESFSLVSIVLMVAFLVALCGALRRTSLAPALWGTSLGLLSQAVLAVEAVPRVVFGEISNLYHAPSATLQDQATLALIWQTTQSIFYQLDTVAVIFQTMCYILLGMAMLRNPVFGKRLGGIVMVLAVAALAGLYLLGIDSLWYAPLGPFVLIFLPLLLGWKVFTLSRVV